MDTTKLAVIKKEGILKNDYQLVWEENFLGEVLDTNKWNIEIREPGWVNNELQAYTNRSENLIIENNNLIIKTIKERYKEADYTSGRINTSGKIGWKYGRFEIRARIPKTKGVWPAIWLLSESIAEKGWPKCGEIDIMEHINNEDIIYGTIHSEEYNHMTDTQIGGKVTIENLDKDFVRNLSKKLLEWTGKRWVITLTKKTGLKTFSENKLFIAKINAETTSLI